ncbi:MAG: AMP-binding protein, partial [Caldimonas sp.]
MRHEAIGLHELPLLAADRTPDAVALLDGELALSYGELAERIAGFARALSAFGICRGERVAIYLDKRIETVVASFAAPACGAVFVPINPLLKPDQVAYILRDCNVRALVTSEDRLRSLEPVLAACPDLAHAIVVGKPASADGRASLAVHAWADAMRAAPASGNRIIDNDIAAILYTSGSTGKPKGVVLSHRNMVAGAKSVASYLGNHDGDVLLAALPLSFDAGFSQLTTAFH